MKLTIERDALFKAMQRAAGIVPRSNVHPILGNVRLDAADDWLTLTATDLDAEVSIGVECRVEVKGSTTVPAVRLHDLLRNMPSGGQVGLEQSAKDPQAKLACGRTRANLPTLPPGDFPMMTSDGVTAGGAIAPSVLARLFDVTRHAISTETTRFYLTGAYLHVTRAEDGEPLLRAVSTDGHRLALAEMPAPDGFEALPSVIVPTKTVDEIGRLLAGASAAEIRTSETKVALEVGRDRLVSKVLEANFPDYVRVIPRDNPHRLRADVAILSAALKRAATMADDKSRSIRFNLEPGQLALSVRSDDSGTLREEVEVDYAGEPLEFGFNGRIVAEMLNQVSGETVELQLRDPMSPALALDPLDSRVRFVLMPLRV